MEKIDESYTYVGEIGVETVRWELYDISWVKFLKFSRETALINLPIRLIWYKEMEKEMKTVNYVFDEAPEDMFLLICVGKEKDEIEVFLEHDISNKMDPPIYLVSPNSQCVEAQRYEQEKAQYSKQEKAQYSDDSSSEERPLEDEEPERSEDEHVVEEENEHGGEEESEHGGEEVNEHGDGNADIGDDVVEDAGNGGDDQRFKSVFEEGSRAKADKTAYQNLEEKEEAQREAEESEVEEGVLEEDGRYPDTPLESEEEWEKCDFVVSPITMKILEKARVAKQFCSTLRSSKSVYEVNEFDCGYSVNLSTHQCACRKWDLTGIPCKHAICIMDDNNDDPVRYVAHYYYTDVLKKTYEENIKPVNGEKFWKKTHKPPIGIPEFRKPRGRPKTRERRKEPFEDLEKAGKATRHGRIPHCSRCKQAGHISRGCKNEPVVVEGPKNRRGRPRKNEVLVFRI